MVQPTPRTGLMPDPLSAARQAKPGGPDANALRDLFESVAKAGKARQDAVFEPADEGDRRYLVYITPRSGSTYFSHLARSTGVLGFPQEWLNFNEVESEIRESRSASLAAWMAWLEANRSSANGVFGMEVSLAQWRMARELGDFDAMTGPRCRRVYLRRRNLVRQAISLHIAFESGVYHSFQLNDEARALREAVPYHRGRIGRQLQILIEQEASFERQFRAAGIEPERFYYEDVAEAPDLAMRRLANLIGVEAPSVSGEQVGVERIGPGQTDEWEERYRQEDAEYLGHMTKRRPLLHIPGRDL